MRTDFYPGLKEPSLHLLLYQEGAFPGTISQWDSDKAAKIRAAHRKYRKLERLAQRQHLSMDELLLRRDSDRRWAALQAAVGSHGVFRINNVFYYVDILETVRIPQKIVYNWTSTGRHVEKWTERGIRVRINAYMEFIGLPEGDVLPIGEVLDLPYRQVHVASSFNRAEKLHYTVESYVEARLARINDDRNGGRGGLFRVRPPESPYWDKLIGEWQTWLATYKARENACG